MKTPSLVPAALALASLLFLAGCDTFNSRAKEKSEVYDSLSEKTQKRLERGTIHVDDTPDMVYIALGDPDEKRNVTSDKGSQQVWIYRTYWQQYEGQAWVGWRRVIVPARGGRGYIVYHEPVSQDLYRTRVEETIRVVFANDKVTSVDQQK